MDALRDRGLRASTARRLVLEALSAGAGPLTADQIAAGVDGRLPRSDLASVYRNLGTLEQAGLVRHLHLAGAGRYELASGEARDYLLCERCGELRAVDADRLSEVRRAIADCVGWAVSFDSHPMVGRCDSCQAGGS